MKLLPTLIYAGCLVSATRHMVRCIKGYIMHPNRVNSLYQLCLVISSGGNAYIFPDVAVFCFDHTEMEVLINHLKLDYTNIYEARSGQIRSYNYYLWPTAEFRQDRKRFSFYGNFITREVRSLDRLPFDEETNKRFAQDVRRLLKHRIRVIE